jgi:hypothetical protein
MPYSGGSPVGYQVVPVRKGIIPVFSKIGRLSRRRKSRIKKIAMIADTAVRNQIVLIAVSFRSRDTAADCRKTALRVSDEIYFPGIPGEDPIQGKNVP